MYQYKKARPFTLNQSLKALSSNAEVQNITVLLDLFAGNQFTTNLLTIKRDVNNTLVITAKIEGYQMGFCIITVDNEGRVYIRIELPENNQSFNTIYNSETGELYLGEIDNSRIPEPSCDVLEIPETEIPPHINNDRQNTEVEQNEQALNRGVNTIAEIDIMVVYTPAAENYAIANHGGMSNVIATMMATNQTVFDNSLVGVNINLVYSQLINYTETGDSNIDLERLQLRDDGFMDEVHQWRVDNNADLVTLITTNQDVGGMAYVPGNPAGSPNYGFSLLTIPSIVYGPYTPVHEIGHNMGCHHHKLQNMQPGPGIFDYSAGWRWTSTNNGKYCSVMTYGPGSYFPDGINHSRVPYFSNPNINYIGTPTGHAVDGDNARTIRETKHVIAAYSENLIGCSGGAHWPTTIFTPTLSVQTIPSYSVYYTVHNIVEGTVYYWSFCADDGGSAPFDSQITLRRNDDLSIISSNDDFCGDDAKIKWTATFTGQVRVLVNESYCQGYSGVQATLAFGIDTSTIFYDITTSAEPSAGGTSTGDGTYGFEENVLVSASSNTGYEFINWTENGIVVSTNANYSFNAQTDRVLIANFELETFQITAQANPTDAGTIIGAGVYTYGDSCILSTTENSGYTFINWTENGTVVSTDANYSFIVTENKSVVANFDLNTYNISTFASPSDGGTITGGGNHQYNSTCNLFASPNPGYGFVNWTENGTVVSADANYSFTVVDNKTLTANFELGTFQVSAEANPTDAGTVIGGGNYTYGDSCTLSATENLGYTFINWTENGTVVSTDANYSFTVEDNRNLIANFDANFFEITATAIPTGGGSIAGAGQHLFNEQCTLIATNNSGYGFINWTENGTVVATDNNYSFTVIQDRNLEANFAEVTLIPDPNFEQALIDLGYDDIVDGQVLTGNIQNLTELNISNKSITDLTGIESFSNLEVLNCSNNNLTQLNTSQNTVLKNLKCFENQLTSLDTSFNPLLEQLNFRNNAITSFNVSQNQALLGLTCGNNPLSTIDISQNVNLQSLNAYNSTLTSIDLSQNINLSGLSVAGNSLTDLDVSNNPLLQVLEFIFNQITTINLSNNPNITALIAEYNQLSELETGNMPNLELIICSSNSIAELDFTNNPNLEHLECQDNALITIDLRNGHNPDITTLNATNNPLLTCVYVDNKNNIPSNWNMDPNASFIETEAECEALGIDDFQSNLFFLYPNPAKNSFSITSKSAVEKVSVYDISGKLIKIFTEQNEYDVSTISKGLYLISIQSETGTSNKKLIIE